VHALFDARRTADGRVDDDIVHLRSRL
jgi:hypothetical protein